MAGAVKPLLEMVRRLPPARRFALGLGAAAVLLIATSAMPWATYSSAAAGTVRFGGGGLGLAVLSLAGSGLALALCLWLRPVVLFAKAAVAVGAGSLVVSSALALHSISRANEVHRYTPGPSSTAYALGSVMALFAALAMTVVASLAAGRLGGDHSAADGRSGSHR